MLEKSLIVMIKDISQVIQDIECEPKTLDEAQEVYDQVDWYLDYDTHTLDEPKVHKLLDARDHLWREFPEIVS